MRTNLATCLIAILIIAKTEIKAQRSYENKNNKTRYTTSQIRYNNNIKYYETYNYQAPQVYNSESYGVNIEFNNSNYGYANYHTKSFARNAIKNAKYKIKEARNVSYYYQEYHHMITLSIRHYNFARTLYLNREFNQAISHANRANRLAQNAISDLSYLNNDFTTDEFGYRKVNPSNIDNESNLRKKNNSQRKTPIIEEDSLDKLLPQNQKQAFDSKLEDL